MGDATLTADFRLFPSLRMLARSVGTEVFDCRVGLEKMEAPVVGFLSTRVPASIALMALLSCRLLSIWSR